MKISKTATYDVTFQVGYFEALEGGMDSRTFGPDCSDLSEAIHHLELAEIARPGHDWIITATVSKSIKP
jgi:hypothetical protein